MTTTTVTLSRTAYTQINTGLNPVKLQNHGDNIRVVFQTSLPAVSATNFHVLTPEMGVVSFENNITNVWALAMGAVGTVVVTEDVRSTTPELDLVLGRLPGVTEESRLGAVRAIDIADSTVTIWSFADDYISPRANTKPWPSAAVTLYISSASAADTSKVFTVEVINGSGVRSYVTATTDATDGRTPVAFAASAGMDVNDVRLTGSGQTQAGDVYINMENNHTAGVPNDATKVIAFSAGGSGKSRAAAYYVPAGFSCHIKRVTFSITLNTGAACSCFVRLRVRRAGESWVTEREWELENGTHVFEEAGLVYAANSRIELDLRDTLNDDTNVTGKFDFDLVAV